MEEVLTRRFTSYLEERAKPLEERSGKFQLPAAAAAGRRRQGSAGRWRRGCSSRWASRRRSPSASLAKQFEEVFVPGQADPVRLPRQSEALFLLQRMRDESHRFAITYHRQLRDKRMTKSVLDDIAGLGPTAQEAPGQGARRRPGRAGGRPGGSQGPDLASRGRRRSPSTTPSTRKRLGSERAAARRQPARAGPTGSATPSGGRRGSPTVSTPSTRSRSCPLAELHLAGARPRPRRGVR